MTTRKELVEALRVRYGSATFGERIKILEEFVALTGYHRKHAIRVLRDEVTKAGAARARNRVYDEAVRQALTMLWEAADRVCGKRLKALIPVLVDAMERHGHLDLDPTIKTKVLQVSAATIDRVLAAARLHIDGQRKRRKGVGSAIRRSIPAPKAVPKPEAANGAGIDRQLPAHLPRKNRVHRPGATDAAVDATGNARGCTACGGRLRQIGADVSGQLEFVPARFKVIRHVRPKLACVSCETIFQAAAPSRPIARGVAGPALLANVLVSKYCDHIPLHRLARIHAHDGVCFDPSTYGGWVEQSHALLDPLVAALGRYALAGVKVHADDTPVPVLDPVAAGQRPGGCGSTFATTGQRASPSRRQPGTATRPTARASNRKIT